MMDEGSQVEKEGEKIRSGTQGPRQFHKKVRPATGSASSLWPGRAGLWDCPGGGGDFIIISSPPPVPPAGYWVHLHFKLLQSLRQPRRPEAGPPQQPGLGLQLGPGVPGNVAWAAAAQKAPPHMTLPWGSPRAPKE